MYVKLTSCVQGIGKAAMKKLDPLPFQPKYIIKAWALTVREQISWPEKIMYLGILNDVNCVFHISTACRMSFFNFLVMQIKLSNQMSQYLAEGKVIKNFFYRLYFRKYPLKRGGNWRKETWAIINILTLVFIYGYLILNQDSHYKVLLWNTLVESDRRRCQRSK